VIDDVCVVHRSPRVASYIGPRARSTLCERRACRRAVLRLLRVVGLASRLNMPGRVVTTNLYHTDSFARNQLASKIDGRRAAIVHV